MTFLVHWGNLSDGQQIITQPVQGSVTDVVFSSIAYEQNQTESSVFELCMFSVFQKDPPLQISVANNCLRWSKKLTKRQTVTYDIKTSGVNYSITFYCL